LLVTNTLDNGAGSLRQAIMDANANQGADTIQFNLPISDANFVAATGIWVIKPLSELPALNDVTGGTTIDGRTQTAFGGDTNALGPEVLLDGSLIAGFHDGLFITSSNNQVFGLTIERFGGRGIEINGAGASNNWVAGNYIGTDATGKNKAGNATIGVVIGNGASNNYIGVKTDVWQRNLISGNTGPGLYIPGPGTSGNVVAGNYVGTDATGMVSLGNSDGGITIQNGAVNNIVGGTTALSRNVISGNFSDAVSVFHAGSTGNVVAGNFIGTNAAGTAALGNGGSGIHIAAGASSNRAQGNVISGNGAGVLLSIAGTDRNVLIGNLIGTDVTGTVPLGNAGIGVDLGNASNNTIGGSTAADRNVISANGAHGVFITGGSGNVLAGNYIGTDVTGAAPMGNGAFGVVIRDGSISNRIGTDGDGVNDAAEGNVISANTRGGVVFDAGATGNVLAGNFIGTNAAGTTALANGANGVTVINSPNNTIGGTTAAALNVISGNGSRGIDMSGAGSTGNLIQGNIIGLNAAGNAKLGNTNAGVWLHSGAAHNTIGGLVAGAGNVVSGNGGHGVQLGDGSSGNCVQGNYLGTDASGSVALGNGGRGMVLGGSAAGSSNNLVGGDVPEARNVISGNGGGIQMLGAATTGNVVAGNYIGTNAAGTAALANGDYGVLIHKGANNNTIGTNGDGVNDAAERNVISGNVTHGVWITGSGATGNVVAGNYIGTNATGTAALANGGNGVQIDSGVSNNRIGTNADGIADAAERNVISGNGLHGILIDGSQLNVVAGNYVGTDAAGALALGNGGNGVQLSNSANNRVGGSTAVECNVISGNQSNGIWIPGNNPDNNVIQGNIIGLDAAGTAAVGNAFTGVLIDAGTGNKVSGNIISGNGANGVALRFGGTMQNFVMGNYIGTDVTGTVPLANGTGVLISGGAHNNVIGTDSTDNDAEGNVIAFNAGAGIIVRDAGSTGNSLRGNAIYSNGGLGIDLGGDGVTLNDSAGHVGPNDFQNFPALSLVEVGAMTHVVGSLTSTPNTSFVIDFYVNTAADPNGYGQGAGWLSSVGITSDASGHAIIDVTLPQSVPGQFLTATATDSSGNTSEFSRAVAVHSTPQFLTTGVTNLVSSGVLTQGQGTGLTAKVMAAERQISRGNNTAAINQLQAFIHMINSLVAEGIFSLKDADSLLSAASLLINQLGG
jgi:hypothetical protein